MNSKRIHLKIKFSENTELKTVALFYRTPPPVLQNSYTQVITNMLLSFLSFLECFLNLCISLWTNVYLSSSYAVFYFVNLIQKYCYWLSNS